VEITVTDEKVEKEAVVVVVVTNHPLDRRGFSG